MNTTEATETELYWEIDDFRSGCFSLLAEGEKIYKQRLTKADVEKKTGLKLRRAATDDNPDLIVSAHAEVDGEQYLDRRKSLRGQARHFYMIIG